MNDESFLTEEGSPQRLFLPSLAFSYFATGPMGILTGLLLIDIALTFERPVGTMGQMNTVYYAVAVVFALFMGVLSVRFRHKSLLMIGLVSICLSALGCFFASDFNMMLASYSLSGVGTAMVTPMTMTMIGEHFPLEKRSGAIGWIVASGSLSYVIVAPVIGFLAGLGGWRFVLFALVLPISLASLSLAFIGLPATSRGSQHATSKEPYLESFKSVLSNKSATACLVGNILRSIAFIVILLYGTSFFRQRFLVPTHIASIILLAAALCYTFGSLVSGRFVGKFGRKHVTALTTLLAGAFTMSFVYLPNLWLSMALDFLGAWSFGIGASSSNSLTLEQVPRFRGTMMSINSAAMNLGSTLGAALGGMALLLFDYEGLGISLGAVGIVAAIVFYLLTIDPTRT